MKRSSLLLAFGFLFPFGSACSKQVASTQALPFQFTNIVHEPSAFSPRTQGTIISFTNGFWFSHYPDKLTLGIGTSDYEATAFFDPTNHVVTKIIQQITLGTNHYWLIDRNGDGLPDERRQFSTKVEEVLFRGEWTQTRGRGTAREISADGEWAPIHFERGSWRLTGM